MKKKQSLIKSLVPFIIVGVIIAGFYTISTKKVTIKPDELKTKLIPLKTVQAGSGFEDLEPLKEILKDKQIIAMGDATYGNKESTQMKHRMSEFLVEKMGYRVIGIDAGFGAVQRVNNYILNGSGNGTDAFKGVNYNEWYTEDVADMVEWLRKYNENPDHKTKVKLYGFASEMPYEDKKLVLSYIKKVDENVSKEFEGKLRNVIVSKEFNYDKENIQNLKGIFNKNKDEYIKKTSVKEFEVAAQCLEVVSQSIESSIKNNISDYVGAQNLDNEYIAKNIKWILDYESKLGNEKIVLWTHNSKVNKSIGQFKSMGEHLKDLFNDKYYSIAFDFYGGTYMAYPSDGYAFKKFNLEKSKDDSFSAMFEKTGIPLSFIDFKAASQEGNMKKWLSVAQKIHSFKVYDGIEEHLYGYEIPIKSYDALIFIKEISTSKEIK